MLYLVAGILKAGSDEQLIKFSGEMSEHLSQPFRKIVLAGALRDKSGKRQGYLAFIEASSFDDAQSYLDQSPLFQNDLYERVEVAEFDAEVGYLE